MLATDDGLERVTIADKVVGASHKAFIINMGIPKKGVSPLHVGLVVEKSRNFAAAKAK